MSQEGGRLPYYDKPQKTVFGKGYSIKFYTRHVIDDEIEDIFFYEDQNINFYFFAERKKWAADRSSSPNTFIDTEVYRIEQLWCEKPSRTFRKNVPESFKATTRANIAEGMMVMEGEDYKPPTRVIFERT